MKKYIKILLLGTSLLFQTFAFSQTEVTVLMVYTDDARAAAGGVNNIETQIISAIDDGNLAMDNSNVNMRLSIADMREVSVNENIYTEARPLTRLLSDLADPLDSVFDVVHQWRDEVGADIVYLIFEGIQSNGQANEICGFRVPCDESFEDEAFAVSQRAIMLVAPIVTHELGHVMGLFHDRTRDCDNPNVTCNTGLFPYSYGHIDPQAPVDFGTIMAGGRAFPLINFFSNPDVNHPTTGQSLGVDNFSDAARHLNNVASIIGDFRVNDTGLGATPENPASSCSAILASRPDVSSGVYWFNNRSGDRVFEAYCDMTTDGGGWMLVLAQFDADPVTDWNEGIQTDYDPTLVSGNSFALNSDEIPAHSQVSFGSDLSPTDIDYVNFEYSTGDIRLSELTGLKTDSRYFIHRSQNLFYGSHNAAPNRTTGNNPVWNDTLTFDVEPGLLSWAFSPNQPDINSRGFSYARLRLRDTTEEFAWTVWVRGEGGTELGDSPANPAASCSAILEERPNVNNGTYWLNSRSGDKVFEAYCDMTTDGGGWMLVLAQFDADPVTDWNEGTQADYDPTLVSGNSFALNSDEIPVHSQVAFGRDLSPTDIDYVDFGYSTGGISLSELTGLKTGSRYFIHRSQNLFYGSHNAAPNRTTGNNRVWNDTLTFDIEPSLLSWAFSPNQPDINSRGFSYAGSVLRDTTEEFAWTVWVRGNSIVELGDSPVNPADSCSAILASRPGVSSDVYWFNSRSGDKVFEAYCDMTTDGGGWMLVLAQFDADPATDWNEGIQSDYDPTLVSGNSFALNADEISAHNQVAFGSDLSPTDIDYVDFEYSTGDISLSELTGLKTGSRYFIHRSQNLFYGSHNAAPNRTTGNNQVWNDTLTFDIEPGLFSWAFSPNQPDINSRGFSYASSVLRDTTEEFAWTVWVRDNTL